MKTKILVLTALLSGGLLFTSCQKDNSLSGDLVPEQSFTLNNIEERDVEPEEFLDYDLRLTNYPEPFYRCTTIEYELPHSANIEIRVCCQSVTYQDAQSILFSGMQRRGVHTVEFNSCNKPAGEYVVYLNVDNRSIRMTMNKIGAVDTECENPLEQ